MHSFREVFFLFCFRLRLRFYFRGNMSHAVKRPSTYWFCSKIKKLEIVMMFFFFSIAGLCRLVLFLYLL